MSDHSSAEIYREIFRLLASDPTPQHIKWSHKLWKQSQQFDFGPDMLHIEKELKKLGLCRKGLNHDYPEDGEIWLYGLATENELTRSGASF
jgi:hypothetical protein